MEGLAARAAARTGTLASALLAAALWLSGCGSDGGDGDSRDVATIGAAGGTVAHPDGAQVVFPAQALRAEVTVRVAKDGSGAPPLPDIALPAGAVYAITPHGGGFDAPVQVSIPVERRRIAANEQLVLLSAEPGDTQWRVLSAARYDGEKLHAPVAHFSFFQAAVIVDRWVPTLVSTIEAKNNLGGPGIERIAPDARIVGEDLNIWDPNNIDPTSRILARLAWPDPRSLGVLARQSSIVACRPVRIGHDASEWRWVRNGSETFQPLVRHKPLSRTTSPWARDPSQWLVVDPTYGPYDPMTRYSPGGMRPGMGAVHYYGDESPTSGGWYDEGPFERLWNHTVRAEVEEGDPYPLPPAGNRVGDDLLTWEGQVTWSSNRTSAGGFSTPGGPVRVDVTVLSDCGLLIEAAPIYFVLAARGNDFVGFDVLGQVYAPPGPLMVSAGAPGELRFRGDEYVDWSKVAFQFSRTPLLPESWTPVDAARIVDSTVPYPEDTPLGYARTIPIASAAAADAGFYRARFCYPAEEGATPRCTSTDLVQVIVLNAPPTVAASPQSIAVLQGETASFTVAAGGAPPPAIQWQRRAGAEAPWVDIAGATATTYTTPTTTLADAGSEFRAVVSNAAGSTASGAAVLTIVERFVAPSVTGQPTPLAVPVGGTAVFAATVAGTAPLSFQWRRNGVPITGANLPILTLNGVTGANEGSYDLVASNRAGSATSQAAILSVVVGDGQVQPVAIAAAPVGLTVAEGNSASFAVSVTGSGPFLYQWQKNGVAIADATGPAHQIANAKPSDAGSYSVRVSNVLGSATSAVATLSVSASQAAAPQITTGPVSLAVLPGAGATFAIAATGSAPLAYQWRREGADIPGATGAVLHLGAVSAGDGGLYSVVVSNPLGTVVSGAAQLVVIGVPGIVTQPVAVSVAEGGSATFSVSAIGSGLRYQWLRDRVAIVGATAATYTTTPLATADDGARYSVLVYNGAGALFSQEALLTVNAAPPPVQAWAAPVTIHPTVTAYDPAVGIDASGRALAVWNAVLPGQSVSRVYFASGSVAGGWSTPSTIDGGLNGYETKIGVTPGGLAVAAWGYVAGGVYHVAASRFDGSAWAPAVRVDTTLASNASEHLLAVDDTGRALLVWTQPSGDVYGVYASISTGGAWSTPVQIDRGARAGVLSMAVNGAGRGFVLFNETSDTLVAVPVDLGSGFGTPQVVRAKGWMVGTSRVTVDAQGNALAIWIDSTIDGDRLRWSRSIAASGWSAPADVDAIGWPFPRNLVLAGSASGDAAAVWMLRDGDDKDAIWTRRFSPAGGWGTLERLSTVGRWAETPNAAMNASGRLVVSWKQSDETNSIYQTWARVHDGAWRDAQRLATSSNDGRADAQRGLAVGPAGSAAALWVENAGATEPLLGAFWP